MCGIVGFTGAAQAAPILLDGLAKLEYRGYDSAGLAVQNAAGKIEVVKAKGRPEGSERNDRRRQRGLRQLRASAIPAGLLMANRPSSTPTRTIPVTRKSLSYTTASLKTTRKLKSAC